MHRAVWPAVHVTSHRRAPVPVLHELVLVALVLVPALVVLTLLLALLLLLTLLVLDAEPPTASQPQHSTKRTQMPNLIVRLGYTSSGFDLKPKR